MIAVNEEAVNLTLMRLSWITKTPKMCFWCVVAVVALNIVQSFWAEAILLWVTKHRKYVSSVLCPDS